MAHAMVARARRAASELAHADDARLADAYIETLSDERNLHFSPYLVTALVDAKQWDRLDREITRRRLAAAA